MMMIMIMIMTIIMIIIIRRIRRIFVINKYAEEAIVVHWSLTISVFAQLNNIITPINNNYVIQ